MKRGFTLIELLITIAIIGSLAGFVLLRLVGPEKGARDAKRENDLRQYANALEVYANKNNGTYPIRASTVIPNTLCGAAQPLGAIPCPDDSQASQGRHYQYISDTLGSKYILWVRLEKTTDYFLFCSAGAAGKQAVVPNNANCPNNLAP